MTPLPRERFSVTMKGKKEAFGVREFKGVRQIAGGFLKKYELTYDADGREVKWEVISLNDLQSEKDLASNLTAVELIARFPDGDYLLCREFRFAVNDFVWEFPTGMIEKGESPEDAARRELREETGLELVRVDRALPKCCYSVGLTDQIIVPLIVTVRGEMRECNDAYEAIRPCKLSPAQVRALLRDPELKMTETCLMYLAGALGE